MPYPSTPADLRRRGLIFAGIAVTLLLSAALAYTVLVHRSPPSNTAAPGPGTEPLTPPAIEHQALEVVAQVAAMLRGEVPAGAVNAGEGTRLRNVVVSAPTPPSPMAGPASSPTSSPA